MLILFLSLLLNCDLLHGVEFEKAKYNGGSSLFNGNLETLQPVPQTSIILANLNFSFLETGHEIQARKHNYFSNNSFIEYFNPKTHQNVLRTDIRTPTLGNETITYDNTKLLRIEDTSIPTASKFTETFTTYSGIETNTHHNLSSLDTQDSKKTTTSKNTETFSTYTPISTKPALEETIPSTSVLTATTYTPISTEPTSEETFLSTSEAATNTSTPSQPLSEETIPSTSDTVAETNTAFPTEPTLEELASEETFPTTTESTGPYITVYPPGFGPTEDTDTTLNPSVAEFAQQWLEEIAASTATSKLLVPKLDDIFGYDYSADKFPLPMRRNQKTPQRRLSKRQNQRKHSRRQTRPIKYRRATELQVSKKRKPETMTEPQIPQRRAKVDTEPQISKTGNQETVTETQVPKRRSPGDTVVGSNVRRQSRPIKHQRTTKPQIPKKRNTGVVIELQRSKAGHPKGVVEPKTGSIEDVTKPQTFKKRKPEAPTEPQMPRRNPKIVIELQIPKRISKIDIEPRIPKAGSPKAITETQLSEKRNPGASIEPQISMTGKAEPFTERQQPKKRNPGAVIEPRIPKKRNTKAATEPQISKAGNVETVTKPKKKNPEAEAEAFWYDTPTESEEDSSDVKSDLLRSGPTTVTKKTLKPDLLLGKATIGDHSNTDGVDDDGDDDDGDDSDDDDDDDDDDGDDDEEELKSTTSESDEIILRMHDILVTTKKEWYSDGTETDKDAMRFLIPTPRMDYVRHTIFPSESTAQTMGQSYAKMKEIRQDTYLTVFLVELARLISAKKKEHVHEVFKHVDDITHGFYKSGNLQWIPKSLVAIAKNETKRIMETDTSVIQNQATKLHHVLRQRSEMLSDEVNKIIEYADRLYDNQDGEVLMKALNEFAEYPNSTLSSYWLCNSLINGFLRPYRRLKDTRQRQELIGSINCALAKRFPSANKAENGPPDQPTCATKKSPKERKRKRHRSHKRKRQRKKHRKLLLKNWTLALRTATTTSVRSALVTP